VATSGKRQAVSQDEAAASGAAQQRHASEVNQPAEEAHHLIAGAFRAYWHTAAQVAGS